MQILVIQNYFLLALIHHGPIDRFRMFPKLRFSEI